MTESNPRKSNDVLLHACCGICAGYPIQYLKELGYNPVVFYYNPNIQPEEENNKRFEALKKVCKELKCELLSEVYEPKLFDEIMTGRENYPEGGERCKRCFELRLLKTVQKAKELGFAKFTTTLSVSPNKDFGTISQVGRTFAECFDIDFLAINFKKNDGFLKSNKIAKSLGLYRQYFCGCPMSKAERDKQISLKNNEESLYKG